MPISPIATDLTCMRCGQVLRGLHPKGKCPGCGFGIINSIRVVKIECLACGHSNRALARECSKCGHSLLPDANPEDPDGLSGPIDADCPCVECRYNLRGLERSGRCPECGTKIATTMRKVKREVLCAACFTPNPAVAAVCTHCAPPLTGAATTANYFGVTPMASGRSSRRPISALQKRKPTSRRTRLLLVQFIGALLGFFATQWVASGSFFAATAPLWVVYAFVCLVLLFLPARR